MDESKENAQTAGSNRTLEQLSAEVEQLRKRERQFDAYTMWSGKELRAQRREIGFARRRVGLLSVAAGALLLVFIGYGLWGYQQIREGEMTLRALPDPEMLVASVDERVDAFADRLADLGADSEIMQGFGDRIAALENANRTTLDALRTQVEQAARIEAEVRLETARRLDEVTPRIEAVESSGREAGQQLADLGQAVARMRSEIVADLTLLELQTADMVRSVGERVAGNERGLDAVSWEVGRERLDFELFEDYRLEVAPGVVLNVSDVDVAYQKVDGWLHLVDEGRFLRIDDHPVQRSLVFYGLDDDRSYELVFTRVRPELAVGYVRVPSEDGMRVVDQVRAPGFQDQLSSAR